MNNQNNKKNQYDNNLNPKEIVQPISLPLSKTGKKSKSKFD
jgi:hypothetical protein